MTKQEILLSYLDIAKDFRNHEFNIQMLRNVTFSASQAILLTLFVIVFEKALLLAILAATVGLVLSLFWRLYYSASLYWARYWELRCREINDLFVEAAEPGANLFRRHPIGSDEEPEPVKFGGKYIYHRPVHRTLVVVQILFAALWLLLGLGAALYWQSPPVSP